MAVVTKKPTTMIGTPGKIAKPTTMIGTPNQTAKLTNYAGTKTVAPKPVTPAVVDPTKLTGAAERLYRQQNPNSDYTKSVDTRYISTIGNSIKNNTGVTGAQMNDYNARLQKWNMTDPNAPKPFDQKAFLSDMEGRVNGMFDAQKQSQLATLQAQRDKAVGQINQQKAEVAPQYQGMRNQADVVSTQNVQRLRELMASNGLNASGENVTAQTSLNNQRQSSLNSLNLQEQQTMNDYNRQITDLNNPADEQALVSSIEAQRNQSLYDAYNRASDVGYQRQRDSIGDSRYNSETTYNHGRDTAADKRYADETTYNHGRDARQDAQWESEQKDSRQWRKYAYENMSASEKATLDWAKTQYGEDAAWRLWETQYKGEIDKSMSQAQIDAYTSGSIPGIP